MSDKSKERNELYVHLVNDESEFNLVRSQYVYMTASRDIIDANRHKPTSYPCLVHCSSVTSPSDILWSS